MSQWFVESSGQIHGPFTTESVQSRLMSGTFSPNDKVWGRVMEDWRALSWWNSSVQELQQQEKQIVNPEIWHYANGGASFGPLAWNDLINNLKSIRATSLDQLTNIVIWTKGMTDWAPVLEFHEIVDALGVNRREFPRADIKGKAVLRSLGNVYISPLMNISEGGFGAEPIPGLLAGESVTVELQCDDFKSPLHAKAQVRYSTSTIIGCKFTQINVEMRGMVIQYVRKSSGVQKFILKAG